MAWLSDIHAATFTQDNVLVIAYFVSGGIIRVSQPFLYAIGKTFNNTVPEKVFANFSIVNNTVISLIPAEAPTGISLAYNNNSPNISFSSTKFGSSTLLNSDVSILFTGASCGSFKFPLGLNLLSDFKAFDLQTKYFFEGASGGFQYPVFKPGSSQDFLLTATAIAPLDILNQQGLPTYFALKGETLNQSSGNTSPSHLPSYFSINTGYPLTLWPKIAWEDPGIFVPSAYCARLVISPQDSNKDQRFYLQPEGDFYLDPGALQAQQADENGQFDFLPGLSGTESISFTPYSAANASGDVLRFKSKQPAFASNFPAQELSLTNPGTDSQTLAPDYVTSWATIVSEVLDNNQYSSQPEGASLYAKDHGVSELMAVNSAPGKANLLGYYEPTVNLPQKEGFYIPIVPYLAIPPKTDPPPPTA